MTDPNDDLYDFIADCTRPYRKGEVVTKSHIGETVEVTTIDNFVHVDDKEPDEIPVDMHFVVVGVDKAQAEKDKQMLLDWLDRYPEPDRLAGGPSYIELGGVIGDQTTALCMMAAGKVLGLWAVITPKTLGVKGDEADAMAGQGFVMISGYAGQTVQS